MTSVENLRDVLPDEMLRLWEPVGTIAKQIKGRLVGGTAATVHMQHRLSVDIDIMTHGEFSGSALQKRLAKAGVEVDTRLTRPVAAKNQLHCMIVNPARGEDNIKLEIFRAFPSHEVQPSEMRWINPAVMVDDMPVASPADLMACKLDVIEYRGKVRDYVDVAAFDQRHVCLLEDGLRHYCTRFGYTHPPRSLERIIDLLEQPGHITEAPMMADAAAEAMPYLAERAPSLREHLKELRNRSDVIPVLAAHAQRQGADDFREARGSPVKCGKPMPRAKKRCVLSLGHAGHCSSVRH